MCAAGTAHTQTDKTEITRLTAQVAEERNKSDQRIQDMLAKTAPRPGIGVLAAFPSGEASAALVALGILVLIAGFLLGRHGRSRRRSRLISGGVSALVALGVYVGSVALLPDTRLTELLFAVTAAVLVVVCRALIRSQLELRWSGQVPPPSP